MTNSIENFKDIELITRSIAKKISGLSDNNFYKAIKKCTILGLNNEDEPVYSLKEFCEQCNPKINELFLSFFGSLQIGKTTLINLLLHEKSVIPDKTSNSIQDGVTGTPKKVNAYSFKEFLGLYPQLEDSNDLRILKKIYFRPNIIFEELNLFINKLKQDFIKEKEKDFEAIKVNLMNKDISDIVVDSMKIVQISINDIIDFYSKNTDEELLGLLVENFDINISNSKIKHTVSEMCNFIKVFEKVFYKEYNFSYFKTSKFEENSDYSYLDKILDLNPTLLKNIDKKIEGIFIASFKSTIDSSFIEELFLLDENKIKENIENKLTYYIKKYQQILLRLSEMTSVYELLTLDSTNLAEIVDLIEYDAVQNEYAEKKLRINKLSMLDTKGTNDRNYIQANHKYFQNNDINIIVTEPRERINDILNTFTETEIQNSKLGFIYVDRNINAATPTDIVTETLMMCEERTNAYRNDFINKGITTVDKDTLLNDLSFTSLFYKMPFGLMPSVPKYAQHGKKTNENFAIDSLFTLFAELRFRKLLNIKLTLEGLLNKDYKYINDFVDKEQLTVIKQGISSMVNGNRESNNKLVNMINQIPKNKNYIYNNLYSALCLNDDWANKYTAHYTCKMGYCILKECWNIAYSNLVSNILENNSKSQKYSNLMDLAFLGELKKYIDTVPDLTGYEWWGYGIVTQRLSNESYELTKKDAIYTMNIDKSRTFLTESSFDNYMVNIDTEEFYYIFINTCIKHEIRLFKEKTFEFFKSNIQISELQ